MSSGEGRLRAAFFFCALAATSAASAQDASAGAQKAQPCFACHGPNGNSVVPQFPSLAGQTARYIYLQLRDYQEGRRTDAVMQPLAKPLSREDMLDVAAFFAAQKPLANAFQPDPERAARGKAKADETLCTMCHLGSFSGQNEIPRVAGQQYDYTVKQLRDFKARVRTNDAGNMTSVARTLSDQDIEDLGHYTASLY
jgi:cytochrome c553